jgi:hypothetical protein
VSDGEVYAMAPALGETSCVRTCGRCREIPSSRQGSQTMRCCVATNARKSGQLWVADAGSEGEITFGALRSGGWRPACTFFDSIGQTRKSMI